MGQTVSGLRTASRTLHLPIGPESSPPSTMQVRNDEISPISGNCARSSFFWYIVILLSYRVFLAPSISTLVRFLQIEFFIDLVVTRYSYMYSQTSS